MRIAYPIARILGLLLVALLPTCTVQSIPSDLNSGIEGTMMAGPQCPVVGPGTVGCEDKPYQGTVIVKTANGLLEVTRFMADAAGNFSVPLYPGTYLLQPLPVLNGFPHASEQTVEVQEGAFTQVDLLFDTGIR
ncbi:MAG: hypothetical protein ACYTF1_11580 [Planctomycetota bacterium]